MKKILLLIIYTLPLIAISQIDTVQFDEILISEKKQDNVLHTNISGNEILLESPHDVGEIFKRENGFGIVKRGNYAMEPVLRGFKYEQLNVQMNDCCTSTNACPNRMDPAISQITPEDIEKVEIIRGPYSVRYGPSFGGVLNIVTKQPERTDKFKISGNLNGGYQSNGGNRYADAHFVASNKIFDVVINGSYKDFGNYLSGDGDTIKSSFKRNAYSVKLGINPAKNHRIQLGWQQGFAKDIMHPGLPMDAEHDFSSILNLDYQVRHVSKSIFSLKMKLYASFVDHLMTNEGRKNYLMTHAKTPVVATVYGGRTELGVKVNNNNLLFSGVDFKQINKDGYRNREVYHNACNDSDFDPPLEFTDKVWQNSQMNDLGLFVEDKFKISPSLLWVSGIRIDLLKYAIKDAASDFAALYGDNLKPKDQLNFSINTSLNYQILKGLDLQWSLGRGVRSPELTELFINHFSVGMDAYEYLGNPDLKSEINTQTDVKIEKQFEKGSIYANIFYSYLKNYITAYVDTTIPRKFLPCKEPKFTKVYTNIDKANLYGLESGFDIDFLDHFNYNVGVAYTFAQNISWDEPLSEIPPLMINTAIAYKTTKISVDLKARINAAQNRVSESFNESTTPGFTVLDFYVSYKPVKYFEVYAAVINIFNKNYVEHLSRAYKNINTDEMPADGLYYEPGRSVNAGLKILF